MTNDLIERYIYAVTKRMPTKIRNDVSNELRSLIDDMLTERCGDILATEKDIKVVLTELGSPQEITEIYNTDNKNCLIGYPYYSTYKSILKIVCISTIFGICLSAIIIQIILPPPMLWYESILEWFTKIISGLIFAFSFVTLLFAFFYHKDIKINDVVSLDNLPPAPNKNQTIAKWQPIAGIGLIIIFLIVFLLVPQFFGIFLRTTTNEFISIFNIEVIRNSWSMLILFSALGIIREIIKLIEGRYNKSVMLTSIVVDIISIALAFLWLLNKKIINPKFIDNVNILFIGEEQFILMMLSNFQYFFLGTIVFALLLDSATAIIKVPQACHHLSRTL